MTAEIELGPIRELGEEIRSRLFPTVSKVGLLQIGKPVRVEYAHTEEVDFRILFVPEACVQRVGVLMEDEPDPFDVSASAPFVPANSTTRLAFGEEPWVPGESDDPLIEALGLLLRAVAGVL